MNANLQSRIPFYHEQPGDYAPIVAHATITHSSEALGWNGVHLETGSHIGCLLEDISAEGIIFGMNLLDEPLTVERREGGSGQWVEQVFPAGAMWLYPEGAPISLRHQARSDWAVLVIDGTYLDTVLGGHHELTVQHVFMDPLLGSLMHSLINLLACDQPGLRSDAALAKSISDALIIALARRYGQRRRSFRSGGIAPHHLNQLLQWIEANIDTELTVEAMAERVGLSMAHFSREFKRSTGFTPWSYVIDQRLHRALEMIREGEKAKDVAYRLKFCDLPHLCRAMRTRFGLSPSELLRRD